MTRNEVRQFLSPILESRLATLSFCRNHLQSDRQFAKCPISTPSERFNLRK